VRLRWVLTISIVLLGTLGFFGYESIETNSINEVGLVLALAGIALAIVIPMFSDWSNEPDFEILANEAASNANPPGFKLLNVIVRSKRNLLPDTRAEVTLFLDNGKELATSGKWGNQPEPVLQLPLNLLPPGSKPNSAIFQGWLTTMLRTADIPDKGELYLDFAVKHPGEPEFYAFDAWSYAYGLKWAEQKIAGQTRVKVKVEIQTGTLRKTKEFEIENPSSSLVDFKLKDV
jgi:hypothetical protein